MKQLLLQTFAFLIISSVVVLSSCTKHTTISTVSGDTTQRVQTQTNGIAVNKVSGDKELLREALILANNKGTLQAALTEAAQDSAVGPKMQEAVLLASKAKKLTTPAPTIVRAK